MKSLSLYKNVSVHLALLLKLVKCLGFVFIILFNVGAHAKNYDQIQWVDLIPKADLDALLNPPASVMNIPEGSEFDVAPKDPFAESIERAIGESASSAVKQTPEEAAYFTALNSTNIIPDFNKKNIRIAGFVVPLEYGDNQVITEFFLVPYFGACIHVPPPPPNQIIYVNFPKGLTLEALYDPFWVEGQILTEVIENDLAMSAYSINANDVLTFDKFKL